jgi:mono/diheme cytochrome c family protein
MKTALCAGFSLMLLGAASAWAGGDADAGQAVFADNCEECHFEDDFSGTSEEDIMASIKAVLSGETDHEDADLNELGLSEADLANVAAYFAAN